MQVLQDLPPIVALVLGLVLLAWLVLVFLVPFMIEGIRQSTRKTHEELAELNKKLDRLNAALMQSAPLPDRTRKVEPGAGRESEPRGRRDPEARGRRDPEARGRREPTISDSDFNQNPPRERREPLVK